MRCHFLQESYSISAITKYSSFQQIFINAVEILLRLIVGKVMDTLSAVCQAGLMKPLQTTYETITILLVAETEQERDELTKQWRDHKLEELNFIGIVGALLAGCLTSTGSWPTILPNGRSSPWTVQACWYTGIVFALFSVLTAAQQSVRLHRLSAPKAWLEEHSGCDGVNT